MDQLISGISMSGNRVKKKNPFFWGSIILAICFSFVIFTSGCLGEEKISEHDAVSIAVNDSRTHNLIQNHEFSVVDVSLASITSGETNPRDMYAVTIKVQNGTPERIIVFVSFNGEVVRVDSPYTAKAPDDITQNPILIATTSINRQTESILEIYDSDSGARYQISQENAEYHLLLDNMTIVLQSIRYQKKCSRPYEEFQMIKSNYRYVALIQDDNISGRYCYNSGNCKNITADEFTILLTKKTGEGIETGCLESGLIFAYNNRTDAGIWSLAEENYGYMENLTGNVQTIIDSGKIDSGYRNNPGLIVTPVQTPSCHSNLPLVPAGGNVWLGERCLDLSSVVSSGQVISWYTNGRNVGNTAPDISRIVYDSQNFSVNPDEFLGFEGNWYLGNTDKIAFVVRVPILHTNSTSAN